jgi:hypothetical protein
MNCCVTHRAGLIFLRLVMERGDRRGCRVHSKRMAFQAEQVNVAPAQQSRIGGAVRRMASNAPFCLDRSMFESKRSGFVCMAVEAELILGCCSPQLVRQKATMRIVAITAADQAFINFVMERLGKIRLHVEMAGEAKLRLRNLQQLCLDLWSMDRVAIGTADIVLNVLRAQEVGMLLAKFMAAQAAFG